MVLLVFQICPVYNFGTFISCELGTVRSERISIIFSGNFKLQEDPYTIDVFSLTPLVPYKWGKNMGNFLVRRALKPYNQPSNALTRGAILAITFRALNDLLASRTPIHVFQLYYLLHILHCLEKDIHQ